MTTILFLFAIGVFIYLIQLEKRIKKIEKLFEKDLVGKVNNLSSGYQKAKAIDNSEKIVQPEVKTGANVYGSIPSSTSQNIVASVNVEQQEASQALETNLSNFVPNQKIEEAKNSGKDNENFEYKIGGKIATWVGIVSVIMAVGFFLRYAFQEGWINEITRVILGILFGFAMIGCGLKFKEKYPNYGKLLSGGGIGILYLSIFASYEFYHIASPSVAFLGMVLVTASGIFLSLKFNSMPLSIIAQIGGLVTPILLSSGENPHALFSYLAILNIGILAISYKKIWKSLSFISFFGTLLIYSFWLNEFYSQSQFFIAEIYATLFFLIFFGISFFYNVIQKSKEIVSSLVLIAFNTFAYFSFSYYLFEKSYSDWTGFFVFTLAIFNILFALAVYRKDNSQEKFRDSLISIGIVLFTIAIPIQFDKAWNTIFWSLESLVLSYLGLKYNSKTLRFFGILSGTVAFLKLVFLDVFNLNHSQPFINERMLSYLASIIFFSIASFIYLKKKDQLSKNEIPLASFYPIISYVLFIILVSLEIESFYSRYWMPISWSLIGFMAILISIKAKLFSLRMVVYLTFLFAMGHLFIFERSVLIHSYTPVLNNRVFSYLATSLFLSFSGLIIYKNRADFERESKFMAPAIFIGVNLMMFILISLEVLDYFNKNFSMLGKDIQASKKNVYSNIKKSSLSVTWTVYAIFMLAIGILRKFIVARIVAIFLLAIVVFKVFLYDTAQLNDLYRFISYITLGLILIITGFLYNKYKSRISKFIILKEDIYQK